NHGSVLLSDSRHGNYLTNKARSLVFTTTLSPLLFSARIRLFFFVFIIHVYRILKFLIFDMACRSIERLLHIQKGEI
ncbi:MAG: hypothetical protein JXA35_05350, partial [Deltaproteobacteria bacterium]|nr:hypothetical protein [Deltaproteobacteria bacterium]